MAALMSAGSQALWMLCFLLEILISDLMPQNPERKYLCCLMFSGVWLPVTETIRNQHSHVLSTSILFQNSLGRGMLSVLLCCFFCLAFSLENNVQRKQHTHVDTALQNLCLQALVWFSTQIGSQAMLRYLRSQSSLLLWSHDCFQVPMGPMSEPGMELKWDWGQDGAEPCVSRTPD